MARTNRLKTLLVAAAAVAALASSTVARGQTDESCIAANESAVSLLKGGRLIEARQQLALCAAPTCPDPVRTSCQDRLEQINRELPSIIFDVKDGRGNDLVEFRLSIDGVDRVDNVRGTAIPLNPGNHEFRFEVVGQAPVVKELIVRESEQFRREVIVIGPIPAAPTPAQASQGAPSGASLVLTPGTRLTVTGGTERSSSVGKFQRTMGTLLLAVGLPAGLIASLAYGGVALADWSNALGECKTSCVPGSQAQSDLQDARDKATVSTILSVATGAVLVGGIVLRVTAPSRPSTTPTVVPVASSTGGGLLLQGGFQ